jgi:hypothetical protein
MLGSRYWEGQGVGIQDNQSHMNNQAVVQHSSLQVVGTEKALRPMNDMIGLSQRPSEARVKCKSGREDSPGKWWKSRVTGQGSNRQLHARKGPRKADGAALKSRTGRVQGGSEKSIQV